MNVILMKSAILLKIHKVMTIQNQTPKILSQVCDPSLQ